MFDEILQDLLNINITEQEINEFLNSNNENSLEYIESIIEDVNDLVNSEAIENANIESSNDEAKALQSSNDEVCFTGFDDLYEKLLALEDQLICKEFENGVGEDYENQCGGKQCFKKKGKAKKFWGINSAGEFFKGVAFCTGKEGLELYETIEHLGF